MLFPKHVPEVAPADVSPPKTGYQAHAVSQEVRVPLILVVDDNREIAEMARDALSDTGYRVITANSAEEALAIFQEAGTRGDPIDLVFSDVMMPGGANGLVLAEQLRGLAPHTPVLLTTGYNDEMSLDGPQADSMEVLGKPYKRAELIDRIQAALQRGRRVGLGRQTSDFGHAQA